MTRWLLFFLFSTSVFAEDVKMNFAKDTFESAQKNGKTVVINSWNKWCYTCVKQEKILKEAKKDFNDVLFLSYAQKNKDIARKTLVDMALMNKELNNIIINQKIKNEIDIILKAEPNNYKNLQIAGECYTVLEDYTTAMNYYNQAIDLIDDEAKKKSSTKENA